MHNSHNDLSEIINHVEMEYWLSREGVEYKVTRGRNGVQLNVRECPICGNQNWKVYISQETGLGNCFHGDCETKFSKWSFVRGFFKDLSNKEVAEHLKAVSEEQGYQPKRSAVSAPVISGDLQLPKSIALPTQGRNLKYLNDRSIDKETTKEFGLRFCQKGWFKYKNTDGADKYQNYSGRVIIPIFNLDGELVSFQGRDITGTSEKKYLFPPGFASTGSIIYNGQNAYGAVEICMGEGVFDVMAIHKAFKADSALCNVIAVGSFGKSLSFGDESSQLARFIDLKNAGLKRVTIMWDGEDRALKDAIEAGQLLKSIGLSVRIAVLPKNKDPNEVSEEMVRKCFYEAKPLTSNLAVKFKLGNFR